MYPCEGYGFQAKEARLILRSGIFFVTNILKGKAFLFQGQGGGDGCLVHSQTAVNQRSLCFLLRSDYICNAGFFTQNQL